MTGKERKTFRKKDFAGRLLALIMALTMFVAFTVVPQHTYALARAKKAKVKYKITVHNINSDTVLRKGTRLKISYTATKTKKGVVSGTKVKFRSSNKKVATVSRRGIIKAKKKGTVKITVYCKKKPGIKKTVKIRVGAPVSSIGVSGDRYLRVGRSSKLKASVNSGATNKSVTWWSDNPAVASVNDDGKIRGVSSGICTVYATARDGSGVSGARTVYVHQYLEGETKWIAHRGLHTSATENTATAFLAAGQSGGFWGCECDIWETRHEVPSMPSLPGLPGNATVDEYQLPDISGLTAKISVWPGATSMDIVKKSSEVVSVWKEYNQKTNGLTEDQLKLVHKRMISKSGEDLLAKLFDAYKWIKEYESIDIVINHDSNFAEIWGNGSEVRDLSADEIKAQLSGVCFFGEYLDICKAKNRNYKSMVPVIEFKDPKMSSAAINKALEMVNQQGLLNQAYLISFYDWILNDVKTQAAAKLGHNPTTYLLISDNGAANIDLAKRRGYTGVSLSKSLIDSNLYNRAKNYKLGVGTWTYRDKISDDEKLYKHMFSYGWKLDFVTVDYHIFN